MIHWLTTDLMQLIFAGFFLLNATEPNQSHQTFSKPHAPAVTEKALERLTDFDVSHPLFIFR